MSSPYSSKQSHHTFRLLVQHEMIMYKRSHDCMTNRSGFGLNNCGENSWSLCLYVNRNVCVQYSCKQPMRADWEWSVCCGRLLRTGPCVFYDRCSACSCDSNYECVWCSEHFVCRLTCFWVWSTPSLILRRHHHHHQSLRRRPLQATDHGLLSWLTLFILINTFHPKSN